MPLFDPTNVPSAEEVNEAHINSDVDKSRLSQHHTLGLSATQASPGNHNHDGITSVKIKVTDLDGVMPGGLGYAVYALVRNNTGATLTKGTIVYTNGATGNHVTVAPARADADATSARVLGWVADDIGTNSTGNVIMEGYLENIDTNAANDGDQLYLSPTVAGGWTATKPVAPYHMVYVGVVAKKAGNGAVMVKVQNGYELPEIHDVLITSPTNDQVLTYESSTGLWKNKTNPADGVTSITATAPLTGGTITSTGSIGLDQTALSLTQSQVTNLVTDLAGTAKLASANTFTVGGHIINNSGTTVIPLQINGVASQTSDLLQVRDSAGNNNLSVSPTFGLVGRNAGTVSFAISSGAGLAAFYSQAAGNVPMTLRGAVSQTADLLQLQDNAGNTYLRMSTFGGITTNLGSSYLGRLSVGTGTAATIGVVIRGVASQTANLLELQNSAASVLFSVGSGGAITSASGLTINGVGTFNNNISAFGTTTLWANQQLSLAVRNGVNAVTNLVQYSKNDTTVTGGVTTNGLIWAGNSTGAENNITYNLSATNPYVSSTQATFTTSSTVTYQPFAVGQKIIVSGASQAQYNSSWIATAVGGSSGAWTVTVTSPSGTTPFTNGGAITATGTIALEPTAFFKSLSNGTTALTIKSTGTSGTATDVFRYIDGAGALKTYITSAGDIVAPAITAIWSITSSAQDVTVNAMRARTSVASGYRANLQTWENSTTVLAGVNSPGKIFTGATSPATTTIGGTIQSIASGANPLVTMASAHGLSVGEVVTLAGTTGGTYDGTFFVATVPASTTFTITSALTTGQVGAAGTLAVPAQMTSIARNAGSVAALIRGASGQLASFVEVQNNAGTSLLRVNTSGFVLAPLGLVGGGTTQSTNTSSVVSNNTLYPTSATNIGLAVRGAASQTANLQEWQDSTGGTSALITSAGRGAFPRISAGAATDLQYGTLSVLANNTATVPIVARGVSGQSANLQEWQISTGGTVASVSPTGVITTTGGLTFSGASAPLIAGGTAGTSGQVLTSGGAGVSPSWTTVGGGGSFTGGTLTSDLVLAAGSTTVEPLTFQTNSSTPTTTSGAMDYDGVVFYQTSNTNPGRALATQDYYYASSSDYGPDFTVNSTAKSLLGGSTTGITVAAGTTYEYELYTAISHQYVTTASISGDYLIVSTTVSGTPTVAVTHQVDYGSNTTGFTTATTLSTVRPTGNVTFMPAITSGTRYAFLRAKGLIRVTGSGTVKIYPAMQTSGTSGSGDNIWNVRSGTVFKMTPIGNGTVTTVGTWA